MGRSNDARRATADAEDAARQLCDIAKALLVVVAWWAGDRGRRTIGEFDAQDPGAWELFPAPIADLAEQVRRAVGEVE